MRSCPGQCKLTQRRACVSLEFTVSRGFVDLLHKRTETRGKRSQDWSSWFWDQSVFELPHSHTHHLLASLQLPSVQYIHWCQVCKATQKPWLRSIPPSRLHKIGCQWQLRPHYASNKLRCTTCHPTTSKDSQTPYNNLVSFGLCSLSSLSSMAFFVLSCPTKSDGCSCAKNKKGSLGAV